VILNTRIIKTNLHFKGNTTLTLASLKWAHMLNPSSNSNRGRHKDSMASPSNKVSMVKARSAKITTLEQRQSLQTITYSTIPVMASIPSPPTPRDHRTT
jgi:hypothetical protein